MAGVFENIYMEENDKNIILKRAKDRPELIIPYEQIDMKKYVKEFKLLNKLHLIFASTGAGKTIFTTSVIYNLIRQTSKKKITIILLGCTNDAANKLFIIRNILKQEHGIEINILRTKFISELKTFFYKLQSNPTSGNCVFLYFDDIAQELVDRKNNKFFVDLISNSRHSKVTILMNTQIIKCLPDCIKNQTASISLIGQFSETNLNNIYENTVLFSMFSSKKEFSSFYNQVTSKLAKHTIIIANKESANKDAAPQLFFFKVPTHFIEKLDGYRKLALNKK